MRPTITCICGGQLDVFVEPVLPVPHAFIFGAGHISRASKLPTSPGSPPWWWITAIHFANRERFPEAADMHAAEYEDVFPKLNINKTSYIIIVTRGHRDDMRCSTGHRHPGALYRHDRQQAQSAQRGPRTGKGRHAAPRSSVFTRLGLDIGAISPEEIAISVTAEMIAVRRNAASNWRSLCYRCSPARSGPRWQSERRRSDSRRQANRAAWALPRRCCDTVKKVSWTL